MAREVDDTRGGSQAELLQRYGIDLATLRLMYEDWSDRKVPKSVVEARYLRTRRHHGKLFNSLVRRYLGVETERPSASRQRILTLEAENRHLRKLLELHQIEVPATELWGVEDARP
jgi:hypothetical protein